MHKRLIYIGLLALAFSWPVFSHAAEPVSIDLPAAPVAISQTTLKLTTLVDQQKVNTPATVKLTLIVTNTGAVKATNVRLDPTIPVEFTVSSNSALTGLKKLGSLEPGDTISKSLTLSVPANTKTNSYMIETVTAADNASSIQSDVGINVSNGQVLGASDTNLKVLPNTGYSPWAILLFGISLICSGLYQFHRNLR